MRWQYLGIERMCMHMNACAPPFSTSTPNITYAAGRGSTIYVHLMFRSSSCMIDLFLMMGMGVMELRGGKEEERFGNEKSNSSGSNTNMNEKSSSSGRNMNVNVKGSFLCMPRLRTNRVRFSLLERFRAVVFKLIMLSTISKTGDTSSSSSTAATARHRTHHQYSSSQHYSEAVADCIEFIKKSAMDDDDSSIPTPASDHSLQTSSSSCHLCECGY